MDAGDLQGRAKGGARWILGAYSLGQTLRFLSHLLVARWVQPEDFGLFLLVGLVLEGAVLLTDVGIRPAILQSPRGEDPAFIDTAFTVGVIRGLGLSLAIFFSAPWVAALFDAPALDSLLRVGAVAPLIEGFASIRGPLLARRLAFRHPAVAGLSAYAVSVGVLLAWAWVAPSVWALLAALVSQRLTRVLLSHVYLPGPSARLHIDWGAARELLGFGRWIFSSTALSVISAQGERFFLGLHLDPASLGAFAVAQRLVQTGVAIHERLAEGVLAPALAETIRERPETLPQAQRSLRRLLDALFVGGTGFLAGAGPWVVEVLYDERYRSSGWMLQALSFTAALTVVLNSSQALLLSAGNAKALFVRSLIRAAALLIGLPLGYALLGVAGLLGFRAGAELVAVMVQMHCERSTRAGPEGAKIALFDPMLYARTVALFVVGLALGQALSIVWGLSSSASDS